MRADAADDHGDARPGRKISEQKWKSERSQFEAVIRITPSDTWVETPAGRLFVKRWMPAGQIRTEQVPIVLFHDSLGCVELWKGFPEALSAATGREIIAYDRLGFGLSDPNPQALDASFVLDEADLAFSAVLQGLELQDFIVLGHSVGGGMAIACAAAFPERCQGLITLAAQVFVEDCTLDGIRQAQQAFAKQGQLERLGRYHGDKATWVLSAWIDTWLADSFSHWNLNESLAQVRCPVLAMHGDGDEYGSAQHPERIVSLARGPATMEILQDCGHVPHREKPEVVIGQIEVFLEKLGGLRTG